MASYEIDRKLLESKSTDEIKRILRKEREDYTPEALEILEEILQSRSAESSPPEVGGARQGGIRVEAYQAAGDRIQRPGDAVRELNHLLTGVLNGTMDPQVAQVASNIVMGILRAMEMQFMQEPGEEAP
jgi:hypothetical protein